MIDLTANAKMPNTNGWQDRHNSAVIAPRGIEKPLIGMIRAWAEYAVEHRRSLEDADVIGTDGYSGEYWEAIGSALVKLLSAPTGNRLDLGTLDHHIRRIATENGIDSDDL